MRLRPSRILLLALGVSAVSLGLVVAQEAAPPPPGAGGFPVTPSPQEAPAASEAGDAPSGPPPTVTLPQGAAPPEEAEPPANVVAEAQAPPEPAPAPEVPPEPMKRPRFSAAILQAVDKVTAETLRFEATVGEPIRFKGLVMTVHACEGTAADEGFSDAIAHVDVQSQPEALARAPARVVFRGWMFASSPALHPVEHPLYDVWLIACRTPAPRAAGDSL